MYPRVFMSVTIEFRNKSARYSSSNCFVTHETHSEVIIWDNASPPKTMVHHPSCYVVCLVFNDKVRILKASDEMLLLRWLPVPVVNDFL